MSTPRSVRSCYVSVKGLRLHYLMQAPTCSGSDDVPTIIFLHGFPEYSGVWQSQLAYFGTKYRAIALDLPGYNLSQGPETLDGYAVPNLVAIVAEFISVFAKNKPVYLVAHDWGGALAWPLTARFAHLIERLVIINAAHPSTFTREMIINREQRLKSDYIHSFLRPDAEDELSANCFQKLSEHSIRQVRVPLTDDEVGRFYEVWSRPGAVTRMLNYYRAMPQLFPREEETSSDESLTGSSIKALTDIRIPEVHIPVPTLVLWGEQDAAFDIGVLDSLEHYVEEYKEVRFAEASHWIHHEVPDAINAEIELFISE
ncbi:alpha/beta fold hydrolase [Alteromonas facilis]|uniref:alpha/beta fold hydrolase n=1 Tax=Alteromonas facilis TaxID=2048004 RepID=UPI0013DBE888|nr:alpha/beta hydrolase [Alteromonas facilis]